MVETEKTYAPRPPEHAVEVDLSHVTEEGQAEVRGLILKNHLPPAPFVIQFPEGIMLKIEKIEVTKYHFLIHGKVEKDGKEVDANMPWGFRGKEISLKAPNGTWDKETETENEEIDYRRCFELLIIGTLKSKKLL